MDELLNKIENRAYQTKSLAWLILIAEPETDFAVCQVANVTQLLFDLLEEQNEDISKYISMQNKKAPSAPTDQSEALNAHDTTGNGCQGNCTTAAGGNQGEVQE